MSELVKRLRSAEDSVGLTLYEEAADALEAQAKRIAELEARLVEQAGSHNDLVIRKSDRITELSVQLAHAEAKIDALMLEYCPDEMTPEQVENWGKHQRRVSPERTAEIDAHIQSHSANTVGGPTPVIDAAPACEPERSVSESIAAGHPCFDPDGPPDHDWEYVDDSFSHEFGTEICGHYECARCNAIKPE